MIKPWIVADQLRRLAERDQRPTRRTLHELTLMVIDSNDPVAEDYYQRGGADAVVERLIQVCGLTDTTVDPSRCTPTGSSACWCARRGACGRRRTVAGMSPSLS